MCLPQCMGPRPVPLAAIGRRSPRGVLGRPPPRYGVLPDAGLPPQCAQGLYRRLGGPACPLPGMGEGVMVSLCTS